MRAIFKQSYISAASAFLTAAALPAQQGFTDAFPPAEFAARRAKVMEAIGNDVAVLQGTTEISGEAPLRQNNMFFYLTGVTEPRALLIIDGMTKKSTLFIAQSTAGRERAIGPYLGVNPETVKLTGMDFIVRRDSFAVALKAINDAKRVIWTPFQPEVLGEESKENVTAFRTASKNDPWDGTVDREEAFMNKLNEMSEPDLKNLDPVIDRMRGIKSPAEIAVIREATRLAGLGIMEAMRDTEAGMYEYELQAAAEYVYKRGGAFGESYFPLIANGANMPYTHYHKGKTLLKDGDLLQFDWAPDINNYTSDVTRVWPVNGKFTPRQREFYTIYLKLYQAVITSIRPHVTAREVKDSAFVKMQKIMAEFKFSDTAIKVAAEKIVNGNRPVAATPAAGGRGGGGGGSLGHSVGMEVHDVRNPNQTMEPGYIFTIEPQMTIEGGSLSVRLEDMILITETGYEVLSGFVPIEIADIEKLMKEPGLGKYTIKVPKKGGN